MRFSNIDSNIRIIRLRLIGDLAKVSLVQTAKFNYVYLGDPAPQSFGIGTLHALTLKHSGGRWYLFKEWYSDPLTENPKLVPDAGQRFAKRLPAPDTLIEPLTRLRKYPRYYRERAVAYANKFAGTAWGAGNDHRYNRKYRDYAHQGGDCTNFASQAIGDAIEGGGLPSVGGWRHIAGQGGSQSWVQTDAFKNFLLHSGYGRLIGSGDFNDMIRKTARHPHGIIGVIQPGDLIAYKLHGDVDHFSIVVGHDSHGYPLVNSHSADRYRVPFDLGWDKYTKYLFIHIND